MKKEELKKQYKTIDDLLKKLETTYNHQFKEYDVNKRLKTGSDKGALGMIVEEGIFGYDINSNPEADFDYLGIELKTTGFVQNKNGTIRAKERLPLNSLNYNKVVNQTFEESDVLEKSKSLLLVFYEYLDGVPYGDMKIIKGVVHRFSPEDIAIMKYDYDVIVNKIREGKAEIISEGDTMYLGACTAGTGRLQKQPFSDVKAKQRKFCVKNSYFTQLTREYIQGKDVEHILSSGEELKNATFENAIISKLGRFYGKSETQIRSLLNCNDNSKSRYEKYVSLMLGIKGSVNNSDEFVKGNLLLKTIRVEENNTIEQNMSFPAFKFTDIVNQEWEDSEFRQMIDIQKFLFAIFKEKNGQYYFERTMFWHAPIKDLDTDGKAVFDELKRVLQLGEIVREIKTQKNGEIIRLNNLPGIKFNRFIHIRPHGHDHKDAFPLPVKDKLTGLTEFTKQCFWFDKSYIKSVIGVEPNEAGKGLIK